MMKRLNDLFISAYFAVAGFAANAKNKVRGFFSDERGLSGVVVAILLILVAVLAVAAIWAFLGDYIADMWKQITGADDSITQIPNLPGQGG